jgi:hypothetical protein
MAIIASRGTAQGLFVFEKDQPLDHVRALSDAYNKATPFPHAVLDDFLDAAFAKQIVRDFPGKDACSVLRLNQNAYKKRGYRPDDLGDNPCRLHLYQFNTGPFLQFLEALTGIRGLIPDPYFAGGGLHETERGGRLGVHADFNLYAPLNLVRRVNVLIYLNPDWRPEYGGQLELWDATMSRCVTSIAPVFNRCVVFNTDKTSFHGQPDPLTCPESMSRRSIAIYYYTALPAQLVESAELNVRTDYKARPARTAPHSSASTR